MDSPRSDKLNTRFSTPVSELDDHRDALHLPTAQQSNLSPLSELRVRAGPGRAAHHLGSLEVTESPQDIAPKSRDFEQAIIDDDNSVTAEPLHTPAHHRAFSRRVHQKLNTVRRSRESSPSSRSSSPPNSVDAFAEPRRRERANTFVSQGDVDIEHEIHRTVSGETRSRRPTFDSISNLPVRDDDQAEDDVCYPVQEEPSKTFTIDYEEIEEFVALSKRGREPVPPKQRHSFSSVGGVPTNIARTGAEPGVHVPYIVQTAPEPMNHTPASDPITLTNEKLRPDLDNKVEPKRRESALETNRLTFFSSEIEQTIHAADVGDLIMPGETYRDLFELPAENGVWWLDIMNPTEDEISMFQKAFDIHRLTAEDIEDQESREKVELFNQYYFVCFRSFHQMNSQSPDYLDPINVYMVVFREGILTFSYGPAPHAAAVRKRIGRLRNYINLTADWICYAMVDNIVDCFFPVLRHLEVEADQIEDSVFVARSEDLGELLRSIGACRKKVMTLMRLLGGKADVIKGFAKRCNEQFGVAPRGEIGLYLGDIQDHVVTMMSNLGHFEKMLSRSHSNYLAQLSVDQIRQGNRANEVLGKITLIATVLVPLNLICGLFGMNVPVPGGVNDGPLTWFFGIIGIIAAVVVGSLVAAKKLRYI